MMSFLHFRGNYKAILQHKDGQQTHTHTFSKPTISWIEVDSIQRVGSRNLEAEKVGDYYYVEKLIPKRKWFNFRRTEILLRKDEEIFFSPVLHHVILRDHSGKRHDRFGYVRHAKHQRTYDGSLIVTGTIFFSIQDPVAPAPAPTRNSPAPIQTEHYIPNAPGIEDTVFKAQPSKIFDFLPAFLRPVFARAGHGMSLFRKKISDVSSKQPVVEAGGCFKGIFSLLGAAMKFFFIVFIATMVFNLIRGKKSEQNTVVKKDGKVQIDPPRLNPKQDTLDQMPWDYLTLHKIKWTDFIGNTFLNQYSTSSKLYADSRRLHNALANTASTGSDNYFQTIYSEMSKNDTKKLDSVAIYFYKERSLKNLSPESTAEMVISYIQEIPYCLVHDGTCKEAIASGGFMREYHLGKKPCLPNIAAGVQSPYEFAHDLKGDCDTRSLMAYTILTRLNIPASIWISQVYGHSILGVGLGAKGQHYKIANGIRYSPVELTAKGYRLGMISPDQGDMDNWTIILANK